MNLSLMNIKKLKNIKTFRQRLKRKKMKMNTEWTQILKDMSSIRK